jgi:hypothetical protein
MTPFVRTNQSAHLLMKISQIVVVLLLIFMPMLALANPTFPNSGSKKTTPIAGKQSYHAEPVSYQMYNTSAYKVSTTYNPAQTVYTPFSNETPSSYPSRISGRRNGGEEDATDGDIIIEGEHTGTADPNQKPESPIGDAWSLLIFAAMAAGVISLKQRKRSEVKD